MGCLLILSALGLAFFDLFLLSQVWLIWGFFWALALLILPPWLGLPWVRWQQKKLARRMEQGSGLAPAPGSALLETLILSLARILFLWPGPLSTILAILLMIPFFRPILIRLILLRWIRGWLETLQGRGGRPGVQVSFGGFGPRQRTAWPPGIQEDGLKTVQGEDLGSQPLEQNGKDPTWKNP